MRPIIEREGGIWTYAAWSQEDRIAAANEPAGFPHGGFTLNPISLPREAHLSHYRTVTTEYLAHVFHYLLSLPLCPPVELGDLRRAWPAYREVNERFAQATIPDGSLDAVFIEDSHLMLLGAAIRRTGLRPDVPISYFHHIAWCGPDYFGVLPDAVGREILESLLACDAVGFHGRRWADAFLACCARFVPGAAVNERGVSWRDRFVPVHTSPGRVDMTAAESEFRSQEADDWRRRFREIAGDRKVLVRVDRADLWKNALRGFTAYEWLLDRRPELAREAWFLAVMTPTRTWIPSYSSYLDACLAAAHRINERHGLDESGSPPVTLHLADDPHRPDRARALAAIGMADCLLVNSAFEGLPVVAFEGAAIPASPPVLVLSRNAGVHDELGPACLSVNPFDVEATAEAIAQGLDMGNEERASLGAELKRITTSRDAGVWCEERLSACRAKAVGGSRLL